MIKTIHFVNVLSILLFVISLGYIYAYLPVMVQLQPENSLWNIHKAYFFYWAAGGFFVINVFLWMLNSMVNPLLVMQRGEVVAAWFTALTFAVNISLITLLGFLGVFNNSTHVPVDGFLYLTYMGPVVLAAWAIGFIYLILRKKATG